MTAPLPTLFGNRARGEIRARFTAPGGRTGPERLFQAGGLRLRCPRVTPGLRPDCEAVLINTAGGMAGGDTASLDFVCAAGAAVTITTQSAEKIYRGAGAATTVTATLDLGPKAHCEWLPQETILFEGAAFARRLDVAMAGDASLLLVESLVFGRLARGEVMEHGSVSDRWRIRRDGVLVFAEAMAIEGAVRAQLDRPALGAGARATGTLLLIDREAETRLQAVRAVLEEAGCPAAASAWNGMLVVRLLSPSPACLRAAIIGVLVTLRGRAVPRVWQ